MNNCVTDAVDFRIRDIFLSCTAKLYLDRNGILCDNIFELIPYMESVPVDMAKDPASAQGGEGFNENKTSIK